MKHLRGNNLGGRTMEVILIYSLKVVILQEVIATFREENKKAVDRQVCSRGITIVLPKALLLGLRFTRLSANYWIFFHRIYTL